MEVLSWNFIEHGILYAGRVIRRAFRDTVRNLVGDGAAIFQTVVLTLLSWYLLVRIFGWDMTKLTDDLIAPAISIVLAFFGLAAGVFIVRLIGTPVLIDTEQRKIIESFEERLKPRIQILHGLGGSFEQVDKFSNGPLHRMHRIQIKNASDVLVKNVTVELDYVKDYQVPFLPITLRQMHDRPSEDGEYRKSFDINPGAQIFITVVGKIENSRSEEGFYVMYTEPSRPNSFPDGSYRFGIVVTGETIVPQREEFLVAVENGELRFQKES